MEDLNNVKDQYGEQIQGELTKISNYLDQMASSSNYLAYLTNSESAFRKVYVLLFELKLEGKNIPINMSNIINNIVNKVDKMRNFALIDNLIYTRWSTFLHNLGYFNSISKEDWNERSLFYTKCQIDKNNPQKVIFKAHHPGLPNNGGKCYSNAMLKIFSNNTWLYDYFLETEYSISNFNNKPPKYENYLENTLWGGDKIQKTATKSNRDVTEVFINLLRAINQSENTKMQANNFYDILEKANPLFKGWAGDSKDLFLYLLQTVHSVINKPVPGVVKIEQPSQYDRQNTFNWFFTNFVQQEQSIISNTFYGIYEISTQCLECRKKYNGNKTQCPTSYNYQKNEFFSFGLDSVRIHIQERCKNGGKPVPLDPVISLRDCFEYDARIQRFEGNENPKLDNRNRCNICNGLQEAEQKIQIYSLPNDVIINLDRGIDNEFPWRVDLPFYLDCHDTGVIQKTQQYEFKFLTGINQLIGKSGGSAHFVAYTKSAKDGKWYRHSDATVEQVSEQKIKEIKAPDTIEQNLTVCNVVYSGEDTHMSIAQKMLSYVLENVNDENYRWTITNGFDNLAKLPSIGYESAKRFAYLLMYAHANRDNIPSDKLSNLVCAVYEIIEGDSKFSYDSMEHYRYIIQQVAIQISQNKNIVSIQNINDWIVEECCFSKITDSNYKTAIKQWLQNSGDNKGKFLHLFIYVDTNSRNIQNDNLSNLICAVYEMVKNDKDLSDSYMECYKFLIQQTAERISRENGTIAIDNIINWIINKHCLGKVIDQNYKTAITQWLQNSGSNIGRFSHLLVYAATRNITNQNILSNLICAVFDMIRMDDLLDNNKFNVNYGGNSTSVTRMQHYRNIIDATVRQAWNVSNMNPWLYRRGNVQLPRSLTNIAVHNKYSGKNYFAQQLILQMNMNNPYSVDDFVSYLNSNFTRVNNQSMNIQISRGQIVNTNIKNMQNNNTVRQNNPNSNFNNAVQNNQTNNIDSEQHNNTKQIKEDGKKAVISKSGNTEKIKEVGKSNHSESINSENKNIQRDVVNTGEQNMAQNKNDSSDSQENKDTKEWDNLNTIGDNNSQTNDLGNENGNDSNRNGNMAREPDKSDKQANFGENSDIEKNKSSKRHPTATYIFLAIVFIPTVIFSIIFIYLAIQSYEFNCRLEKNDLQNLENYNQENQKNNESKNVDQQIQEINELNKKNSEKKNKIAKRKISEERNT